MPEERLEIKVTVSVFKGWTAKIKLEKNGMNIR
jgi:hypothetical protein